MADTIATTGITAPNIREQMLAAARTTWGDDDLGGIAVPHGRRGILEAAITVAEQQIVPRLGGHDHTYDLSLVIDYDETHTADESVALTITAHPPA